MQSNNYWSGLEYAPNTNNAWNFNTNNGNQNANNKNNQFFANVYLNALDQFVKHTLKCRWYLRYCDDFVLLARSAEELQMFKQRIEQFVMEQLDLQLNPARERLKPVADGVDFLGYIVRPFHLLVRRRVVGHLREALAQSQQALVHQHANCTELRFDPMALERLQARLASYLGHIQRASSHCLIQGIWAEHPWLRSIRHNARGSIEGFPIYQLKLRTQQLVEAGLNVLLIRQSLAKSVDPVPRQPARRWVPKWQVGNPH